MESVSGSNIGYVCGLCQGCFIFILWICRALDNLVFRIGIPIKTEGYSQTWRIFVRMNLYRFRDTILIFGDY